MSSCEEIKQPKYYNDKSKEAMKRYKEKHPEKWQEYIREKSKRYYERNKEKCNKKRTENLRKQRQEVEEKLEELARYKEIYGDKLTTPIVQAGITT